MSTAGEIYILESKKSFHGIKSNAEKAMLQLQDADLHWQADPESNSIAMLMQHISGNLVSRFTDFFSSDGEKPDRNRDAEFVEQNLSRKELMNKWEEAWSVLFKLLDKITIEDLLRIVRIRNEEHTVIRALQRQLVHYSYHCGQIVFIAKMIRKDEFQSLSIPKKKDIG